MVLITNNEDLTAGSGIINMPFLENIYHSFMDEALQDLGGQRGPVIFHLPAQVEQDVVTQSAPAPQQYNPFFGRSSVPNTNTRQTGTKVTHRDVQYTAHIRVGPLVAGPKDITGMGDLAKDEAVITVVVEALEHVNQALSVSIEGRRYSVVKTRPIGFSVRRYLMVKLQEIQETERPVPDNRIG